MDHSLKSTCVEVEIFTTRLRAQINRLCEVVDAVENNHSIGESFIYADLKDVEGELKKMRKYLMQLRNYMAVSTV